MSAFIPEIMREKQNFWGKNCVTQEPTIYPVNETLLNPKRSVEMKRGDQILVKKSLPQEPRVDPMYQYSPTYLRGKCDEYIPSGVYCPTFLECVTRFDVDGVLVVRNAAKLSLNVYNQKEQQNFNLDKVVKLNGPGPYLCMTFTAKNAETDECRLFRGVVNGLTDTVLLCEIKKCDIPSGVHVPTFLEYVTKFDVDGVKVVRNAAKLALNVYNQKEQQNFNLDKAVKLNVTGPCLCMKFTAKNAETDECRLFRGVVNTLTDTVLLCEIKEPNRIAIPSDLVENYLEALSESEKITPPCTRV